MYSIFGQELYVRETLRAAEIVAACPGTEAREAVAAALPQRSVATRERLATKLLQRLEGGWAGSQGPEPFARTLASLRDLQARRELVYYAAARTDSLIAALARDVLCPALLDGRPPSGLAEADFAARNTGLLLTVEPTVSLPFAVWYARSHWQFTSARTVALALRVIREAGLLLSACLHGQASRTLAYTLAPHGISLAAFVWCLYDEAAAGPLPPGFAGERLDFARVFLIPASAAAARLREAERLGFAQWEAGPRGRGLVLPLRREELGARLAEVE